MLKKYAVFHSVNVFRKPTAKFSLKGKKANENIGEILPWLIYQVLVFRNHCGHLPDWEDVDAIPEKPKAEYSVSNSTSK